MSTTTKRNHPEPEVVNPVSTKKVKITVGTAPLPTAEPLLLLPVDTPDDQKVQDTTTSATPKATKVKKRPTKPHEWLYDPDLDIDFGNMLVNSVWRPRSKVFNLSNIVTVSTVGWEKIVSCAVQHPTCMWVPPEMFDSLNKNVSPSAILVKRHGTKYCVKLNRYPRVCNTYGVWVKMIDHIIDLFGFLQIPEPFTSQTVFKKAGFGSNSQILKELSASENVATFRQIFHDTYLTHESTTVLNWALHDLKLSARQYLTALISNEDFPEELDFAMVLNNTIEHLVRLIEAKPADYYL